MNNISIIYSYWLMAFVLFFVVIIWTGASVLSFFVPDKEYYFQKVLRLMAKISFHMIGANIVVKGLENVPQKGPAVFVSNYQNYMDTMIIVAVIERKLSVTAGYSFFKFPASLLSKSCGYLPLDQDNVLNIKNDIQNIIDTLKKGDAVFMFMNLNANHRSSLDTPVTGPVYAAMEAKVPILPISIEAPRWAKFYIRSIFRPRDSFSINVNIGTPIQTAGAVHDRTKRISMTGTVTSAINSLNKYL